MRLTDGSHKLVTERNPDSLSINESCVKSDIANIISKMYSPLVGISNTLTDYDNYSESMGDRRVEMLRGLSDESNKRFGFYFERTTRNQTQTVLDYSSSDTVSVPSARNPLKSPRHVCERCRRRVLKRIPDKYEKISLPNCRICRRNRLRESKLKKLLLEVKTEEPFDCKEQGDIGQHIEVHSNFNHVEPVSESHRKPLCEAQTGITRLSAVVPDGKHALIQESCANLLKLVSDNISDVGEDLQVVPSFTEHAVHCEGNVVVADGPKCQLTAPNKPFLCRFISNFSNWKCHNFFSGNKGPNLTQPRHEVRYPEQDVFSKAEPKLDLNSKRKKKTYTIRNTNINDKHIKLKSQNTKSLLNQEHSWKGNEIQSHQTRYSSKEETIKSTVINVDKKLSKWPGFSNKLSEGENTVKINTSEENMKTKVKDALNKPNENENEIKFDKKKSTSNIEITDQKSTVHFQSLYLFPELDEPSGDTEKVDWATGFWARIFQVCHIALSFVTAFILQLLRFLLGSLVRPLLWGTVEISSDYCLQPCLTVVLESIIKPIFNVLQNIATLLRDSCLPIAQCLGYFLREIASMGRACKQDQSAESNNRIESSLNP